MSIVLLIDDNPDIQDVYSTVLREEGFTVLQATLGKKGLQLAKEHHPDLILLDVMLADKMNGFDFLEILNKDPDLKKIPVIVLSNVDTEEQTAKQLGAVEYLIKSNIQMEEFIEIVKKYTKKSKIKLPFLQ